MNINISKISITLTAIFLFHSVNYRALLDDHDFHEALREIPHEPIPYFTQFGEKPQSLSQMGMKIADLDKTATTPIPQDVTQDIRTHTRNTVAEVTFDVKSPKTSRPPSAKSEGHTPVDSPAPGQQKKTRTDSLVSAIELPARSLAQSSLALHTEEDYQQSLREERKRIEQQTLKR